VGTAVALTVILLVWVTRKPVTIPPATPAAATIPVEIRTDPPGATVKVGDHSCITPNCRLELAPGSYPAEAQLQGYTAKQQTVVFDSSNRTVELTLQPLPAPPAASQSTGTLVVRTTPPDVRIYVDGSPRSRTDQSGSVTLTLEARTHEVRVERNGYETPAPKQVNITAGAGQTLAFTLTAQNAQLELDGAPANLEVTVDGKAIGRTDGSGSYVFPAVHPGDRTLAVAHGLLQGGQGPVRTLSAHFDPGQRVRLSWQPDPPVPAPAPTTPTPSITKTASPTPEEIEERDWQKASASSDPAQVRDFRKAHPNGKHAADAEQLLDRMAWSSTKSDSLESLRDYVRDFPNGAHTSQANSQIGDLAWKSVDTGKIEQVRKFLEENPTNPHALEAQRIIDRRIGQDATQAMLRNQVLDVLNSLDAAFDKKNEGQIRAIWPKVSRAWLDSLRQPGQKMSIKAQGSPLLQGPAATVPCTLHTELTGPKGPKDQNAILSLSYGGGRWLIVNLQVVP
jgi:hypothetical protein